MEPLEISDGIYRKLILSIIINYGPVAVHHWHNIKEIGMIGFVGHAVRILCLWWLKVLKRII